MKHFHRAHLKPLQCDTNPAQFARQGNPWDGDAVLRKNRRKGRRKMRDFQGVVRRPERSSRDESEAMLDYQCRQALAAKLGLSRRTIAPEQEKSPTLAILPSRSTELKPLTQKQRERRGWQIMEFEAKRLAAEQAYRVSEAYRDAERRRIASLIAVMEAKLANI
jgi:hypothetical protein